MFATISAIVFVLDQVSKTLVARSMREGTSIEVIGDLFRLSYVRNPGFAFGIDLARGRVFHIILSLIALVLIVVMMRKTSKTVNAVNYPLALVFGGALGNLIDRIRMGEVVDFLDFGIGTYRWAVFNIADSAVTIGVFLIMFSYLFGRQTYKDGEESEHQGN